jgi:hypothetical protein
VQDSRPVPQMVTTFRVDPIETRSYWKLGLAARTMTKCIILTSTCRLSRAVRATHTRTETLTSVTNYETQLPVGS